ncbi:MAG TPA: fructosamine kinase family protein [Conexibacter sp.]|nr:fructosamine kinase family protein [Conexibacter sp.]
MSAALAEALATALGQPATQLVPVPGGDLNDAYAATLADGTRVFVKTSADPAAAGSFAAEADGLRWLAEAEALPVPAVLALADDPAADSSAPPATGRPAALRLLVLRWIDAGPSTSAAEEALGRGLARLHAAGAPAFGGPRETLRIGPLTLPNEPAPDWPSFYAARRLQPLARLAHDRGALPSEAGQLLDRLAARLPELAGPPEPPARVHGDLWSGNVLVDTRATPWLIDPAAHGGHRELDLAMLRLFGGPSQRCFAAYEEVAPLAPGAHERIGLWQLAPLLLHAALFGPGWGARATAILRRYA